MQHFASKIFQNCIEPILTNVWKQTNLVNYWSLHGFKRFFETIQTKQKQKKNIWTRIVWECGPWIVRSAWKVARMLPGWKGRPARSSEGHLGRKDRQTRRIQHIINNFLVRGSEFRHRSWHLPGQSERYGRPGMSPEGQYGCRIGLGVRQNDR